MTARSDTRPPPQPGASPPDEDRGPRRSDQGRPAAMIPPSRRRRRSLALPASALLVGATAAALLVTGAVRPGRARDAAPLAIIADAILIDARCRGLQADFGAVFAYAEANGIDPLSILPLGTSRHALETAMARRQAATSTEDLCTAIAEQDAENAPGLIRRP